MSKRSAFSFLPDLSGQSGNTVPTFKPSDNVVEIKPFERLARDHEHTISAITDKNSEIIQLERNYRRDRSLLEAEIERLQLNLGTYKDMAMQKIKEIFPHVREEELKALLFRKITENVAGPPPVPDHADIDEAVTELQEIKREVTDVQE